MDFDKIEDKRRISLRRFRLGGAAMLVAAAINHQVQVFGSSIRKPFLKKSLRVLADSYRTPARENRAGEDSP